MKKKLVLMFLFVLYIVPVLFPPSFSHIGIVADQNMNKEFLQSEYGDISNESIDVFSETLESDIMYYPDGALNSYTNYSDAGSYDPSGSGDYEDTHALDATYFYATSSGSPYDAYLYLNVTFSDDTVQYQYFEVNMYGKIDFTYSAAYTDNSLYAYNFVTASYEDIGNFVVDNTLGWINTTCGNPNSNILVLKYECEDTDGDSKIYVDYLEVIAYYADYSDEHAYIETFEDVSEWQYLSGDVLTSDGDLGIKTHNGDATYDGDWIDTPSIPSGYYFQIVFRCSVAGSTGLRVRIFDDTYPSGTNTRIINSFVDTEFKTETVYCTQAIESFRVLFATNQVSQLEIDYIRIFRSNETGWQHDGSSIRGIEFTGDTTAYSNDDYVRLYSESGDGEAIIYPDATDTTHMISTEEYPFLEFSFGYGIATFPSIYSFFVGLSDGSNETILNNSAERGIFTINIHALAGGLDIVCFYFSFFDYGTNAIDFDYIKLYSIANFTLTSGASTTVDDYLYCEDNSLCAIITEDTDVYWILDHDPTLDVSFYYNNYSLEISNAQYFAEYVSGLGWQDWKDDISGIMTKGTVTDFKVQLNSICVLSAVNFIETLSWQELTGVTVYVFIISPYGSWFVQSLMIFGGMLLIPTSTSYIALKIKNHDVSMNTIFYTIVLFMLGFALLVGGIYS